MLFDYHDLADKPNYYSDTEMSIAEGGGIYMIMGTLTTFSGIGSGTEFFTTYTIGVPDEYTQPLTPKKCDVLVDNTGIVRSRKMRALCLLHQTRR